MTREEIIKKALDAKQAEDIIELDIGERTSVADTFIIASANNYPQIDAMKDEVDSKMSKEGFNAIAIEGSSKSGWVILDYGDIVVHIFDKEKRNFYNLERLWENKEEQ